MCHVLIIEDDWIIADHMAQLVATAGAQSVDVAHTEDDAVAIAIHHPPALILSDVHLVTGSGPAAVARIMARLGCIPVVFVTGEPRTFRPNPPDAAVLHKPVDDYTIMATLKAIMPLE
jgi:two-component system, response regulator PdtaR